MNVTIYNTDGVNPYATEIATLLCRRGAEVEQLDAANGEHRPPSGVRWRRLLPANFGAANALEQLLRLVRGLIAATGAAVRGRVLLVTFYRFSVEALLFAVLAALGRPVVVVLHNPNPRSSESVALPLARQLLLRAAATVVVHSERLRGSVDGAVRDRVAVCPHPPYTFTADPSSVEAPSASAGRRWLAFVGALRWDKGIHLLPDILERVPEAERRRIGIVVCGRGSVPDGMWARLRELGYEVEDITSAEPIPQEQLLQVFARRPTLLAPYVAATQSGTAILALSMDCRVLAFDAGGIPDVVASDGLVPNGDLDAMAAAIAADRAGTGVVDLTRWLEQSTQAWWDVVAGALSRPRARRAPGPRVSGLLRRFPRVRVRVDRARDAEGGVDLQRAVDAILDDPPDLVSLDVFDTVLTRRVLGAEHVWHIVAAHLARARGQLPAEDFVALRRRVARARPTASLRELAATPELTATWGCEVEEAEVRVERALLRPVPGATRELARFRDAAVPLVFLSDMHLSSEVLGGVLREHGLATADDRLVVSCEHGTSKADGGLFSRLQPEQHRIVHVGNDPWSDVAMAEAAGLRALAVRSAEPTREERVMGRDPTSAGTAVAAAGRLARLATGADDGAEDRAVRELGAAYGQCFTAFLLWVRARCAAEGIDRVAFLARDGEIPLRMAQAMPADHWQGVDLRYLELAGRRAWSVAAVVPLGIDEWVRVGTENERAFLNTSRHRVPLASLLRRVAHVPEDLEGHPGLRSLDPTRPLPRTRGGAWDAFLADDRVRARILERGREQLELLIPYLEQQIPTDGRLAMVDVGWRGQLAWMMSAVLRDVTGHEPLHLHFGGSNVSAELDRSMEVQRFAFDDSCAAPPFEDVVPCVETFTTSGARRVLGVERVDAGNVTLDVRDAIPEIANAARAQCWAAALEVAAALPTRAELASWGCSDRSLADETRELLTGLWTDPSAAHALAAQGLSLEVDDVGEVYGPVARPYTWAELAGSSRSDARQWREGSLRLTPPVRRALVRLALRARALLAWARR